MAGSVLILGQRLGVEEGISMGLILLALAVGQFDWRRFFTLGRRSL